MYLVHGHLQSLGLKEYAKLTEHSCSPYASIIYDCVNAHTFLNCPTKRWKNVQNCNLAKSFAEQCNPMPHVPLPLLWFMTNLKVAKKKKPEKRWDNNLEKHFSCHFEDKFLHEALQCISCYFSFSWFFI